MSPLDSFCHVLVTLLLLPLLMAGSVGMAFRVVELAGGLRGAR